MLGDADAAGGAAELTDRVRAVLDGDTDELRWAAATREQHGAKATVFVRAVQATAAVKHASAYNAVMPRRDGETEDEYATRLVATGRCGETVVDTKTQELLLPAPSVLYGDALHTGSCE